MGLFFALNLANLFNSTLMTAAVKLSLEPGWQSQSSFDELADFGKPMVHHAI
jgi:hypothetical protein